ncbi:MAG: histidine kinase [Candidatus Didemnitutus sp.]|nr:histidine kinase [Candidatus Didemnitutus sp.]
MRVSKPSSIGSCIKQLLAVWASACLLLIIQTAVDTDAPPWTISWIWAIGPQLLRAAYWCALTPGILWLLIRFPLQGPRRYWHLALHGFCAMSLSGLFLLLRVPLFYWIYDIPAAQRNLDFLIAQISARNVIDPLLYFFVVCAHLMIEVYRSLREREVSEALLKQQLAESELGALKQQVRPHFLFNSLNAVSTLVRCGRNTEAVRMLGQLGDLHRRLVEGGARLEGPLEAEFDFARDYLGIESVRFGTRLTTELILPDECRRATVPSLILQPLIENAVKHGAAQRAAGGAVRVAACREGSRLRLEVQNPLPDVESERPPGTGAGLQLTWRRLEQGYGADARCIVEKRDGMFLARVELPFAIPGNRT